MDEPAYVYLLACADGSLYCGWTVDLATRLAAHRAGRGGRYTRARLPVRYAAAWRCDDRSHARALEVAVKRLSRPEKLRLVGDPAGLGPAAPVTPLP